MKVIKEADLPAGALELVKDLARMVSSDGTTERQLANALGYGDSDDMFCPYRAEVSFNWERCSWIWSQKAGRWIDYVIFVGMLNDWGCDCINQIYVYVKEEENED